MSNIAVKAVPAFGFHWTSGKPAVPYLKALGVASPLFTRGAYQEEEERKIGGKSRPDLKFTSYRPCNAASLPSIVRRFFVGRAHLQVRTFHFGLRV